MSRSNSLFTGLSADLVTLITNSYLSVADVRALSIAGFRTNALFNTRRIWMALLGRDFRIRCKVNECPRQVYAELHAERQRLVAYGQLFLNFVSTDHAADGYRQIRKYLMHGKYDLFLSCAKSMVSQADTRKLQDNGARLKKIFDDIFLSDAKVTCGYIADILDNRDSKMIAVKFSDAEKINLLMSLLVKCGASRTLRLLFSKLNMHVGEEEEVNLKVRFIAHFGGALLCDAAAYHRPEITALLLSEGVSANLPASQDKFSENLHLLPLESAVKALYLLYQEIAERETFFQYTHALDKITRCVNLLCGADADPDANVMSISPRHMGTRRALFVISPRTITIRDYAARMISEVNGDSRLDHFEKKLFCQILLSILDSNFRPVPMVTEDDVLDDDFDTHSDSEDSDAEPSPKKTRSEPATPTKATGILGLRLG